MLSKAQVKYIQSFAHKKFRDEERAFVAEGPKVVGEYLTERPQDLLALYALPAWIDEHTEVVADLSRRVHVVEPSELERISFLSTPHSVLAVLRKPALPAVPDLSAPCTLMLDDIQDPGNLGTIIRTADWFGVRTIICSSSTADAWNPKVVQGTMGSLMRVQVWYTDLVEFITEHPELPVWAAALEGTDLSVLSTVPQVMLLIGNESKGIRPSLLDQAQRRITIPRIGQAESLNAAVATGILLSRMAR
jgi:RNA methyltransferase, TrmH family